MRVYILPHGEDIGEVVWPHNMRIPVVGETILVGATAVFRVDHVMWEVHQGLSDTDGVQLRVERQ